MSEVKNKQVAQSFLGLFSAFVGVPNGGAAMEKALDHLHDDVRWWVSGAPEPGLISKEDFRQGIVAVNKVANGPIKIALTGWTIAGDRIAVEAESDMPLKSGVRYRNHYHFVFEFRDGKISAFKEYHDTAHLRDTIGSEAVG